MIFEIQQVRAACAQAPITQWRGAVTRIAGWLVQAEGVRAPLGALVRIMTCHDSALAQVIGFDRASTLLMPIDAMHGISQSATVLPHRESDCLPSAQACMGRVVDPFGQALDDGPPIVADEVEPLYQQAPPAMQRQPVQHVVETGVRALDGFMLTGEGQRVGIFAGAGVGKSTLLGMLARHVSCDAVVMGLVGERGREVRDFLDTHLAEARSRSITVVATSDSSPVARVRAAHAATAFAEGLRRQGLKVVLLLDSLTRVAQAQREIGLNVGEPPTTKGYPPSAFALLAPLVERAGCGTAGEGSITAFYTVLVEGDDPRDDPVSDAVRGLLDGHVMLDRQLANRGHFPAIDVPSSHSRLMNTLADPEHLKMARRARELMAIQAEAAELVAIGAYQAGSDPRIDEALARHPALEALCRQDSLLRCKLADCLASLRDALTSAESSTDAPAPQTQEATA